MESKGLGEKELKKSRTITLLEFLTLESEVIGEFHRNFSKKHEDNELVFMLVLLPAILARLARKLFDEAEPAMDEAQDADRMEKEE